ncbi:MAG: RNA polymerase sigma factor [Flavisolibacter sp.]|jgi:RNA polymerase sigma factor (sigma-70 family)
MATRLEKLTDSDILQSLRSSGEADSAIRSLYREHFELLGRYVVNNSGSWDDAKDIFQETIIAFVNLVRADKFRGEASIKTFLYALNRNIWLNELKKRGRSEQREIKYEKFNETADKNISMVLEGRETQSVLMKLIEELGENCKKILLLFYYENRPMKEILTVLDYENEQVVRNKKYKCLKRLEELVTTNKNLYDQLKSFLHE